jgi:hypothetical protein
MFGPSVLPPLLLVPYLRLIASSYWWTFSLIWLCSFPLLISPQCVVLETKEEAAAAKNILTVPMINACCVIRYNLVTSLHAFLLQIFFFFSRKCLIYIFIFKRLFVNYLFLVNKRNMKIFLFLYTFILTW